MPRWVALPAYAGKNVAAHGVALQDYRGIGFLPCTNAQPSAHQTPAILPSLMAIYAFGSRVSGNANANANSDWDLAVLVAG